MKELAAIRESLTAHSDEKVRAAAREFIPSSQNVYGVRVPILNELALKHKAGGFKLIEGFWKAARAGDIFASARVRQCPAAWLRTVQKEFAGTKLALCVRPQTAKPKREKIVRSIRPPENHRQETIVMNESSKTPLIIALVVVVVLFLIFGGSAMTGSMMGGGMMGQGWGSYRMGHGWINGGFSWMWVPTLLTLGLGILLGWLVFAKK
jgi:hypothetical protein